LSVDKKVRELSIVMFVSLKKTIVMFVETIHVEIITSIVCNVSTFDIGIDSDV
jgi:hypothetical protein